MGLVARLVVLSFTDPVLDVVNRVQVCCKVPVGVVVSTATGGDILVRREYCCGFSRCTDILSREPFLTLPGKGIPPKLQITACFPQKYTSPSNTNTETCVVNILTMQYDDVVIVVAVVVAICSCQP